MAGRKQLSTENRLLTQIMEHMVEGVCLIRASDGIVLYSSPSFDRMHGYEPGVLTGMHLDMMQAIDEAASKITAAEIGASLLAEGHWQGDVAVLRQDGTRLWCRVKLVSFEQDPYGVVWLAVCDDITHHKQQELQFQALMDAAPDAMVVTEREGHIRLINARFESLFGYTRAEVLGQPVEMLIPQPARDYHTFHRIAYRLDPQPRQMGGGRELYGLHKSGRQIPVEISLSPFYADTDDLFIAAVRDISAAKHAEAVLRETERQFRGLFEQTNDAVIILSLECVHIAVNQRAADMLGYTADELVGMPVQQIIAPRDFENSVTGLNALKSGVRLAPYERILRRKDAIEFPVEVNLALVRDSAGKPLHIQKVIRDITERKQAEAALRESEAQFRGLFEQTTDAIFLVGLDLVHLMVNQRAADMLGYTVDELVGMPIRSVIASREYDDSLKIAEALKTGIRLEPYERVFRRKDGTEFPVEISAQLIRDTRGTPVYYQSAVRDITDRKERERQLRYHASVQASMSDAVIVTDTQFCIQSWNHAAEKIYGWKSAEAIGKVVPQLLETRFELATESERIVHDFLVQGFWQGEVIQARKDQSLVNIQSAVTLFKDEQGQPFGIVAVNRNVTEQKRVETIEREQRILSTALTDTALALTSTLDLPEVFERILLNVQKVVPHHSSSIMLLEGRTARIVQLSGWSADLVERLRSIEFDVQKVDHLHLMYQTHSPCVIADTGQMPGWMRFEGVLAPLSYLAAPIIVDDSVVGFINLDSMETDYFTPAFADRLQAFAAQTAVAFKNATLYKKAQELAMLEERQRIARDLHDSVTQTLFSTTILTDALLNMWQHDPQAVEAELHELSALTHGALAEMRTLLLELRPDALRDADLPGLLRQLVATLSGRTRIKTSFTVQTEAPAPLPSEARLAFFRIAQEALNNVVKHSRAKMVSIRWVESYQYAELNISDDGRGFEPGVQRADHFGLKNMRDRADETGLRLVIASLTGAGTTISALWQREQG